MKKRIFAMVLAASVMLSLAMFASCNGDEYEDLGEMIEVTATVRVVGNDGIVLIDNLEVTLEDYASNITVMAMTRRALYVSEIEYNVSAGLFTFIGDYAIDEDYRIDEFAEDYEDEYENGEEAEAFVDYMWVSTLNGRDGNSNDTISNGDAIVWTFAPSGV